MEQNTNIPRSKTNIPPVVWFLGAGLVIALIAIFIFNVAVSTVAYYGLLAFLAGGHFFMHGGHAGHGGGGGSAGHQHGPVSNADESGQKEQQADRNGGCH